MKWLLFLLPGCLLAGCPSTSQTPSPAPRSATVVVGAGGAAAIGATSPVPPKPKPTLQPDQVDTARLQPAQGHLAPGVLVYTKDGFLWGRVIKVDSDHIFPKGERGGVLFSEADDSKEPSRYWPFERFDDMRVLKN